MSVSEASVRRTVRGPVTCRCDSRTWTSPTGEIIVLSPVGEIDLFTLSVLSEALGKALLAEPRHLLVDLVAARFCCADAFALLADGAAAAEHAGINYAVTGMSSHQSRIAALVWEDGGPRRYRNTATAVIAIQDRRPTT
jgi:anti-anti-sigma regulatory factor